MEKSHPGDRGGMMSHYIEICSICAKVISQCRCASLNKETRYGYCDECKCSPHAWG